MSGTRAPACGAARRQARRGGRGGCDACEDVIPSVEGEGESGGCSLAFGYRGAVALVGGFGYLEGFDVVGRGASVAQESVEVSQVFGSKLPGVSVRFRFVNPIYGMLLYLVVRKLCADLLVAFIREVIVEFICYVV